MNPKKSFYPVKITAVIILLFTALTSPSAVEKEPLLLSFTGDLMAHSINYLMKDYSAIYRNLDGLLLKDDLTFGNIEFPMDPSLPMASFPSFNIHPEYVQAFIHAGLDVLSLANNHIADIGLAALKTTRTTAETLVRTGTRPLYFSGIVSLNNGEKTDTNGRDTPAAGEYFLKNKPEDYENDYKDDEPAVPENSALIDPVRENWPAYPITEIHHKGWKIGFLAVSQKSNNPVGREFLFQVDYTKPSETEIFLEWLKKKTPEYDLFILSYHGGVEYSFLPQESKKQFFLNLVKAGTDIVWGHHPHVLQPVDLVETPRGTKVILYSMGNFLSGQGRIIDEVLPEEEWSYTGDSAIIQITVAAQENGSASAARVTPIPIANYITPNRDVVIYTLEDLVLEPLPPPWDVFYRERLRIMRGYFSKNIRTLQALE